MKKALIICAVSVLILSLIGCGNKKNNEASNEPKLNVEDNIENEEDKNKTEEKKKIDLYFSDDQAMYLNKEQVEVDEVTPEVALQKLIEGPSDQNHYKTLPKETKILSVNVKDGTAYVDVDSSIRKLLGGGSASEIMAVDSIVATLVLNEEFNIERVQFLIDGKEDDTFAGHIDITQPIEPDMSMIK